MINVIWVFIIFIVSISIIINGKLLIVILNLYLFVLKIIVLENKVIMIKLNESIGLMRLNMVIFFNLKY